jgi:hypothetical protein
MNTKYLNLVIHDTGTVLLNVAVFLLFYSINVKMAVIIGGLYCIKTVAGFLYATELKKEDKEAMQELEKILNAKDSDKI